jgi:hypothetical protein
VTHFKIKTGALDPIARVGLTTKWKTNSLATLCVSVASPLCLEISF